MLRQTTCQEYQKAAADLYYKAIYVNPSECWGQLCCNWPIGFWTKGHADTGLDGVASYSLAWSILIHGLGCGQAELDVAVATWAAHCNWIDLGRRPHQGCQEKSSSYFAREAKRNEQHRGIKTEVALCLQGGTQHVCMYIYILYQIFYIMKYLIYTYIWHTIYNLYNVI